MAKLDNKRGVEVDDEETAIVVLNEDSESYERDEEIEDVEVEGEEDDVDSDGDKQMYFLFFPLISSSKASHPLFSMG